MSDEFSQLPSWKRVGNFMVSGGLFLDVIFTSGCDCSCPYCIARTKEFAQEDRAAWEAGLRDAFRLFDIRDVIILGGEATVDPHFFGKLNYLTELMENYPADRLILTTNGNRLKDPVFLNGILDSRIDSVNLSVMHYDQTLNDRLFGRSTLIKAEISKIYAALREKGKSLRINVNVWRGNIDSPEEMDRFTAAFAGCCDAIKFTPLMVTDMFDTVDEVTAFTRAHAIPEPEIAGLWNQFAERHTLKKRVSQVLGFVDYAEVEAFGQQVILKYAQVEDKYDRETVIPTLKLYPNGCLSNEWSFTRDIRDRI